MQEIISHISNLIQENLDPKTIILFSFFPFCIWTLSRANIIYDFTDEFNKRDFLRLKELLADENISENAKIILRNKLNLIAYQK
ncbi:hypothetical protein [Pleurocapsa sp. FMAR1]|uniref:hypothetical protein n=1 Tax=Pleurocapsa sp. FMAR1 TaxID=3040204 RepID=UPI0029C8CB6E|nr:hypothetical protein [Pleurocapsa sp. FMAR1]